MARTAGTLLVLLASASISLGGPICCLLGTGCGSAQATVAAPESKPDCCPRCKREQPTKPAPKPCEKKDCTCKHDVATHATSADHAPLVAVLDMPLVALPGRAAIDAAPTACHASPGSPAPRSHPLLL